MDAALPPWERLLFAWIHVSDLHFGHPEPKHAQEQELVLDALLDDVRGALARGEVPSPSTGFITGDIAFSGASIGADEYAKAEAWLKQLSKVCSLESPDLFLVPGNHDVQRKLSPPSLHTAAATLVAELRGGRNVDDALTKEHALLEKRQEHFATFASQFGPRARADAEKCVSSLYWRHTFTLPEINLRICGLNSALACADELDKGHLQLGFAQLAYGFRRAEPDTVVLFLSHHPFRDWLSDEPDVSSWMRGRTHIHLFGHVHAANAEQVISSGGSSMIRVTAGAGHGDVRRPGEPATHGYNVAALVRGHLGQLQLAVWPRVWSSQLARFTTDIHHVRRGCDFSLHDVWRDDGPWLLGGGSVARAVAPGYSASVTTRQAVQASPATPFSYVPLGGPLPALRLGGKLAVDDAVLLYTPTLEESRGLETWVSRLRVEVAGSPSKDPLVNPSKPELELAIQEARAKPEIADYLAERAAPHDGKYRAKVGIRQLHFENHSLDEPMAIKVAPTCQWIERQLNRRLLTDLRSDAKLHALYEGAVVHSLTSWQDTDVVELPAPGVTFIEACVVTAHGEVLIHRKRLESGSTFAQIDRPWSCGIEVGMDWADATPERGIPFAALLTRGLQKELGLLTGQVGEVAWEGIALECHLNVAFLCTVTTTLTANELLACLEGKRRAGGAPFVDERLVPARDLPKLVFARQQDGKWHTTARLRMLLALRRLVGTQEADDMIAFERRTQ